MHDSCQDHAPITLSPSPVSQAIWTKFQQQPPLAQEVPTLTTMQGLPGGCYPVCWFKSPMLVCSDPVSVVSCKLESSPSLEACTASACLKNWVTLPPIYMFVSGWLMGVIWLGGDGQGGVLVLVALSLSPLGLLRCHFFGM